MSSTHSTPGPQTRTGAPTGPHMRPSIHQELQTSSSITNIRAANDPYSYHRAANDPYSYYIWTADETRSSYKAAYETWNPHGRRQAAPLPISGPQMRPGAVIKPQTSPILNI